MGNCKVPMHTKIFFLLVILHSAGLVMSSVKRRLPSDPIVEEKPGTWQVAKLDAAKLAWAKNAMSKLSPGVKSGELLKMTHRRISNHYEQFRLFGRTDQRWACFTFEVAVNRKYEKTIYPKRLDNVVDTSVVAHQWGFRAGNEKGNQDRVKAVAEKFCFSQPEEKD